MAIGSTFDKETHQQSLLLLHHLLSLQVSMGLKGYSGEGYVRSYPCKIQDDV
jgi:hypothetical protein